jgi:hypothetical protein
LRDRPLVRVRSSSASLSTASYAMPLPAKREAAEPSGRRKVGASGSARSRR